MSKIEGYTIPQIREALDEFGYMDPCIARALLDEVEMYRGQLPDTLDRKVHFLHISDGSAHGYYFTNEHNTDWYWTDVDKAVECANLLMPNGKENVTVLSKKIHIEMR